MREVKNSFRFVPNLLSHDSEISPFGRQTSSPNVLYCPLDFSISSLAAFGDIFKNGGVCGTFFKTSFNVCGG